MDALYDQWILLLFGGDQPQQPLLLGQVAARTFVVFWIGIMAIRLGKGRVVGHVTPLDILMGVVLGSLLSRGINGSASLSSTVVASTVLVGLHWALTAAACRWHSVGNWVKGRHTLLVRNGHMIPEAMARSHVSEHDLREALRLNANINEMSQVAAAYEERNGEISIVRRAAC